MDENKIVSGTVCIEHFTREDFRNQNTENIAKLQLKSNIVPTVFNGIESTMTRAADILSEPSEPEREKGEKHESIQDLKKIIFKKDQIIKQLIHQNRKYEIRLKSASKAASKLRMKTKIKSVLSFHFKRQICKQKHIIESLKYDKNTVAKAGEVLEVCILIFFF